VSYYQAGGGYYMAGGLLDDLGALFPGTGPVNQDMAKAVSGATGKNFVAGAGPMGTLGLAGGRKKYRRMNVLNSRALSRSMRRVQGFARFARKTISFTHHVKMKKHRRR